MDPSWFAESYSIKIFIVVKSVARLFVLVSGRCFYGYAGLKVSDVRKFLQSDIFSSSYSH